MLIGEFSILELQSVKKKNISKSFILRVKMSIFKTTTWASPLSNFTVTIKKHTSHISAKQIKVMLMSCSHIVAAVVKEKEKKKKLQTETLHSVTAHQQSRESLNQVSPLTVQLVSW